MIVKFANKADFKTAVFQRIDGPLKKKISKRWLIYSKAVVILGWAVGSYCALLFYSTTFVQASIFALSLTLAVIGIGFNIQHDGNHDSFSSHQWLNRLAGMTIDLIGGSSYYWKFMHVRAHHLGPNIDQVDGDVNVGWFARFSPDQPWHWHHRFQHIYMWAAYALFYIRFTYRDLCKPLSGKVAGKKVRPPRGLELFQFIGGKVIFFSYALALPMFFHPWYVVIGFYLVMSLLVGWVFAVVFSLAHTVDIVDHPSNVQGKVACEWMVHQLQTTANFASRSWFWTFVLGGLTNQLEHHLLPKVPHTGYRALAPVIRQVCEEQNLPYHEHSSLFSALLSLYRFLRVMGRRPIQAPATS